MNIRFKLNLLTDSNNTNFLIQSESLKEPTASATCIHQPINFQVVVTKNKLISNQIYT